MSQMNLDAQVRKILDEYAGGITEAVKTAVPKVARQTAKKVKASSPKRSGKYAKGWASKVEQTRYGADAVVYGKHGTYQLAHLLEFGHAKRNGGRVAGQVHIAPAEEWAVTELEKAVREAAAK